MMVRVHQYRSIISFFRIEGYGLLRFWQWRIHLGRSRDSHGRRTSHVVQGLTQRRQSMFKISSVLLSLLIAAVVAGCASLGSTGETSRGLVGAWIVTASRPAGVGKNLLTFSSDGTFFRSGDTHPVLSGGHGAWRRISDREFEATYIAFRFDENRKWVGSTKTRIHIIPGPGDNEFTGVAKVSTRDLQDKEIGTSEVRLQGKRIQVEPF